jgi:nickel/cobalt transporter (NiCoT) family protein
MSLIDTTDNILMLGPYGWAFVKPVRKLYYNITITSVSVIVALAVAGYPSVLSIFWDTTLSGCFCNHNLKMRLFDDLVQKRDLG